MALVDWCRLLRLAANSIQKVFYVQVGQRPCATSIEPVFTTGAHVSGDLVVVVVVGNITAPV